MRALKVENHLVRNQLIINQAIEQVVLIEDHKEANAFMDGGLPMTRNVKMCFHFSDGNKRKGRVLGFTPSGGLNDSPIAEYRGQLRMQADKADQIKAEEARLQGIKQELRDFEQAAIGLGNRLNASKTRVLDHQRDDKSLKLAWQRASEDVDRLEDELSAATPDAARIELLQADLAQAEAALKHAEGIYEDTILQKDKLDEQNRANKRSLEVAQSVVRDLESNLAKAHGMIRHYQGQREDSLKQKNQAIAQLSEAAKSKEDFDSEVEEAQTELEKIIREAEEDFGQRVPVPEGKTSEELRNMLKKLSNTRRLAEKELGGSQDQLLREANEAKRIHKDAREEFEALDGLKRVSGLSGS
jgi:chromosome segregation ATPase